MQENIRHGGVSVRYRPLTYVRTFDTVGFSPAVSILIRLTGRDTTLLAPVTYSQAGVPHGCAGFIAWT